MAKTPAPKGMPFVVQPQRMAQHPQSLDHRRRSLSPRPRTWGPYPGSPARRPRPSTHSPPTRHGTPESSVSLHTATIMVLVPVPPAGIITHPRLTCPVTDQSQQADSDLDSSTVVARRTVVGPRVQPFASKGGFTANAGEWCSTRHGYITARAVALTVAGLEPVGSACDASPLLPPAFPGNLG